MRLLKINSSVQAETSASRRLVDELTEKLTQSSTEVINRDLTLGVPLLTKDMVDGFYTPEGQRSKEQLEAIAVSDQFVAEIQNADTIVMGIPIYNFSVPGSVKAYFDLIARVGLTFKFTENGPEGMLKNKKAYIVIVSAGTPFQSDIDFASNYVKHFLGFIGIDDVTFIPADKLMFDSDQVLKNASSLISSIVEEPIIIE